MWVKAIVAAIVSGGLMATCYWPLNLHFLAWIAMVPWLVVLPKLSPGKTWLFGTVVGLVFYRIGLHWMFNLAGPLGGATIVVLAVWMGFAFRVARLLMARFGQSAMLWAVPLTFVGQELLRCEGLPQFRFAFLAFGYSQSHNLWIAEIASLGGVYFLSLLIVAINAAIAYGCIDLRPRRWIPAAAVLLLILAMGVVSQPARQVPGGDITVACVQGEDLGNRQYLDLTRQAAEQSPKPGVVVLPEHTIEENADLRHPVLAGLAQLARQYNLYICVGAHVVAPSDAACDYDNVAMLIGPAGQIVGTQAKAAPLPFFTDGNPARSQSAFDTDRGRLGMYVCYDGTFTDVPRHLVGLGAQLILVPVMDPARWPAQECWQHADMAPFRSIELRRCTVRAASSGISQIIDASGRVLAQRTREQGPGVIAATASRNNRPTLFAQGGYLIASAAAWLFLASMITLTLADWIKKMTRLLTPSNHSAQLRTEN
jgi:apolipoprotein N-acyltransferase